MRYCNRRVQRLLFIIALLLLLISIEAMARLWYSLRGIPIVYSGVLHPVAYKKSNYYTEQFAQEVKESNETLTEDRYGNSLPTNFSGKYVNVADGIRQTLPILNIKPTIYIFGSSTVFGLGVPDVDTLPSQLQQLIGFYKVINRGVSGYSVNQQTHLLLTTTHLHPGDIVIFYDGSMDAYRDWAVAYEKLPGLCRSMMESLHHIALVNLLVGPCQNSIKSTSVPSSYEESIRSATEFSALHKAAFYHFIEPTPFTRPLTQAERSERCGMYLSYHTNMPDVFIQTMTYLANRPHTINLLHKLDLIPNLYIDCYHINENGNEIMANAIYDAIWPEF